MKLCWHRIWHWEYWPVFIVYLPTFFIWVWFAMKFRSLSFYRHSNPKIKNGGLYNDRKSEIYALLPEYLYPKTVLIDINRSYDFRRIMEENQLTFPVIAKPDIGCRGIAVEKINTIDDLISYKQAIKKDFLIQEIIDYPNEIGLFYCRMPGEKHGKITGITLKKFMTIEGDGNSSIVQLLRQSPRYEMQIPKLKEKINMTEVLNKGEKRCLVPYGNHNRGTEFLDGKTHITKMLEKTFDKILSNIPGFYYGRLDIRYNTFEELEKGNKISIIELNGAKSEPTHIYDPNNSFWQGQIGIFRHQKLFGQVIGRYLKIQKNRKMKMA